MCTNFQQPTSFIRVALIITSIFMVSCSLYSQSNLSGFGLELGGGHNQLFTQGSYNPDNYIDNLNANRMNLSFTPTIRLNYKSYIEPVVLLIPFVGYNQFGGKDKLSNGYQDQYWFDAIESGVIGMYLINNLAFGIGIKANYNIKVTGRWLGSTYRPVSANASWDEADVTDLFTRFSCDAGVRVSYYYQHFSINIESWFGVTELQSSFSFFSRVRQNNYRILLGYTL